MARLRFPSQGGAPSVAWAQGGAARGSHPSQGAAEAVALPEITGHAPTSGPNGGTVSVTGTNLPTEGWNSTYFLVLDDGLGVNPANQSGGYVAGDADGFDFTVSLSGGQSRTTLRITNVSPSAGSVTESPDPGYESVM